MYNVKSIINSHRRGVIITNSNYFGSNNRSHHSGCIRMVDI